VYQELHALRKRVSKVETELRVEKKRIKK